MGQDGLAAHAGRQAHRGRLHLLSFTLLPSQGLLPQLLFSFWCEFRYDFGLLFADIF